MPTTTLRLASLLGALGAAIAVAPATAQRVAPRAPSREATATVSSDALSACYVPGSGTMYRVGASGAPAQCAAGHVGFNWTSSAGSANPTSGLKPADPATIDHGTLAGLADDDHLQYLRAEGVRQSDSGFAVTGTPGAYSVPVSGAGVRLMWAAGNGSLRSGVVTGTAWDLANVGNYSTAFGVDVIASGYTSFAVGHQSRATNAHATALGYGAMASGIGAVAIGSTSTASAEQAMALGTGTVASARAGVALGFYTTASGVASTALGLYASTNGKDGSFVYGDNSGGTAPTPVSPAATTSSSSAPSTSGSARPTWRPTRPVTSSPPPPARTCRTAAPGPTAPT